MRIQTYMKTVASVVMTVASALVAALLDNVITTTEWYNIAILFAGTLMVFFAPNHASYPYAKVIISGVVAGLTAASTLFIGGITTSTGLQVGIAVLAAIGVGVIPNQGDLLSRSTGDHAA